MPAKASPGKDPVAVAERDRVDAGDIRRDGKQHSHPCLRGSAVENPECGIAMTMSAPSAFILGHNVVGRVDHVLGYDPAL